jgi:murein DD-endopeptidase MepM/ murein hydrolase activator NlpD
MNIQRTRYQTVTFAIKTISIFIVLALLLASLPQPTRAAACSRSYTVKSGDTLTKIAADYNVDWLTLASENSLKDPYTLYIGQVLCIPASTSSSSSSSTTSTSSSSSSDKFSISFVLNRVMITASGLPSKSAYYVKMNDGSRGNYQWERVGLLRVNKSGTATGYYRMPDSLKESDVLAICLKHNETDAVICKTFQK